MGPKRNPKRRRRRNRQSRVAAATQPVVIYSSLKAETENVPMVKGFTVNDFLSDNTYAYELEHLTVQLMPPALVVDAPSWTSVATCVAQVYGYFKQDESLQRLPMTTWRALSTTQPTIMKFNRKHIKSHIYVGGFVPITIVNSDAMFGIHALWTSGSESSAADTLKMKLDCTVRSQFKFSSDLSIAPVSVNSSDRHMAVHMASIDLKTKLKLE